MAGHLPEDVGVVHADVVEGDPDHHRGSRRSRCVPRPGATLGVVLAAAVLVGCADRGTPSEATVEKATVHAHQAVDEPAPLEQTRTILVLDDCLPGDPEWEPIGGCHLAEGAVSVAEFFAALPQGHPAWQNFPAYARVRLRGQVVRNITVTNRGGREHTFTRVAEFGGGIIPPLNAPGQDPAPECADEASFAASFLPAGASLHIASLQLGLHRYQCCIHPWMRTEIRLDGPVR